MPKTDFYVITTPKHATEEPACAPIAGNILDFMDDVGGGAVLVAIKEPVGGRRYPSWEIKKLTNGPALARANGWDVPDYVKGRMDLISVGGLIRSHAQHEADKAAAKERRAATAKARREAAQKSSRRRTAKKGA